MKSPKATASSKSAGEQRQVRFDEKGKSEGGAFPISRGPDTISVPAPDTSSTNRLNDSGIFIHESTNPSASVSLSTNFHHHNAAPFGHANAHPTSNPFIPHNTHLNNVNNNPFAPYGKYNPCGLEGPPRFHANMVDYQNVAPPPGGLHFQPPVPDTTYGAIPHVYVPRHDNGVAPGPFHGAYHGAAHGAVPGGSHGTLYYVGHPPPNILPVASASVQPAPQNNVTYIGHHPPSQPGIVLQQPIVHPGMPVHQPPPLMLQAPPVPYQGPSVFHGAPTMGMPAPHPMPAGGVPVFAGNPGLPPDVTGVGRTAGENALEQAKFAYANGLFEPQDFKPADDDPSRFYPVREVDGNWTQRNRYTIDNLGDCRWYLTNGGYFYAVRLPN
ncbi:hypothetical protein CTRI78_v007707 [Colletotrichum trifolii]|uniref:Uncharacterized protein n=1 Tax=Colletotrichum trifolii TaxID=5466 RepID=A0A4R8R5D3_COLTR|nr:hypothetical protein CTRI78_v007707 [Colletotrichum trifolii]